MKLSEILGKQLINCEGNVCGYIRGAYALNGKISYLACADGEEKEFNADIRDITEKNGRLVFTDRYDNNKKSKGVRLGLPAYTEDGRFIGFIKDIKIENGIIKSYLIGKKSYPHNLICVGDVAVVKTRKILKDDVVKDSTVILKKGTELDDNALKKAEAAGEYVQAQLKSI